LLLSVNIVISIAAIDMQPELKKNLDRILNSDLFLSNDFPKPTDAERKGPDGVLAETPLFDFAKQENHENNE